MKTYNFNFKSGGWNSVQASSKKAAVNKAMKMYEPQLHPDPESFRVATEADTKVLMMSFW